MTKKYIKTAFTYGIFGLFIGAFYKEFTKFIGFTGRTNLALAHGHSLVLGFIIFLILTLFAKNFDPSDFKKEKRFYITYNIGLSLSLLSLVARGFYQIYDLNQMALDASISGFAGLGHIILALAFYFLYSFLNSLVKE